LRCVGNQSRKIAAQIH